MQSSPPSHASRLADLVARAPKAELHVHIEGTLQPELAFEIGRRNRIALPWESPEALRQAYAFTDLQSFLDIYYTVASVLCTEEDFHDVAWAYLQGARDDNVVRAEIFFDPQTHLVRGVPFEAVIGGLSRAICRAERELGISAALIMCFLRHLSEREALETLERAAPYRGQLLGVGLDSGERGNPPEKFRDLFARCRRLGLHSVAHAGEEGPPEFITAALDALGAERIDHGIRCLEDRGLVARLVRERIPLTVCPLSNVRLRVFETLADHCLPRLLAAGLRVSLHSDDPAFFGGAINEVHRQSIMALPLSESDAHRLLRNGLESAFWEPTAAAPHLERLDALFGF
ncbi:MAG: adenosine deaminase [Planctomycetota bacterium]|nr:MAG: adenosine deaminase [Planctomycetota bacterium]